MDNLSEDLHTVKNDLMNLEPITVNTDAIKEKIVGAKVKLHKLEKNLYKYFNINFIYCKYTIYTFSRIC